MTKENVLKLQGKIFSLGYSVGDIDGIFGDKTKNAVMEYQEKNGLKADGIPGFETLSKLSLNGGVVKSNLSKFHKYRDSILWRVDHNGYVETIEGVKVSIERSEGEPLTAKKIWSIFKDEIWGASLTLKVPEPLIIATIATESGGDPFAIREEPGYLDDSATPNRISVGVMQTLISTAREAMGIPNLTRSWLVDSGNSISAGTAYIAKQKSKTNFDPPKVAAAYNAGGVYYQGSDNNRWKMRQYPIGTSHHVDRFIKWYNDAVFVLSQEIV